jgi:hypothetical protein
VAQVDEEILIVRGLSTAGYRRHLRNLEYRWRRLVVLSWADWPAPTLILGVFFEHRDLSTSTYMDHHHIPRRWGDQLDIGRYIRGGDVSLDVPQLAEDT